MNVKALLGLGLIFFLLTTTLGCSKKDSLEERVDYPYTQTINGHEYRFESGRVTEISTDADLDMRFGVLSDIHGEVEKVGYFAQLFKVKKVDAILISGDIPLNEELRSGHADIVSDEVEMLNVLREVAKTGLPIFVIPGNHEHKGDYENALKKVVLDYPNVIDMTQYRVFDGDDADIVSLPGYQTFSTQGYQFIPDDGYFASHKDIEKLKELRQGLDDPVILLTHGAGKTNAQLGPSTTYDGKDVGDAYTTQVEKEANISFTVVGHIHEAGGRAATFEGTPINIGEWSSQFTVNFGTLQKWKYLDGVSREGMAGILYVHEKKAQFEILELK